jgi:hypothetical protein
LIFRATKFEKEKHKFRKALLMRLKIKTRESLMKFSPAMQRTLMYGAILAAVGAAAGVRYAAAGAVGLVSLPVSFTVGWWVRRNLARAAEGGATDAVTRFVTNAAAVEQAEAALKEAYAAYTEKNRHASAERIAKAMNKKRRAVLRQKIGIRLAGAGGGITAGLATLGAVELVIGEAHAATLHGTDGAVKELVSTAEAQGLYHRIAILGGWFVVQAHDGTYNLYYYDKTRDAVRFAMSGVKNLNEITEKPILELSQNDLKILNPSDRATVGNWLKNRLERPINMLFAFSDMSEEEMRKAGIYTLSNLDGFVQMDADYWGGLATRLGAYLNTTGRALQKVATVSALFGQQIFETVFVAGKAGGMSDQDIVNLYDIIFDKVQKGVDLNPLGSHLGPDGTETHTLMDTGMNTDEDFLSWLFGFKGQAHVYGREDVSLTHKPLWYKAWVYGHEVGHAIQGLLKVDEALNALPAGEREHILREMHDFFAYLKHLRAEGANTGHKGWTESMRQLTAINVNAKDSEIFADLFSKILTNPEEVRLRAPHFYAFIKNLVDSDPKLRNVIGIV